MATISKLPSGKWRAQVARRGIRKSKAFPTKQQARDWAAAEERRILDYTPGDSTETLANVLTRYANEVSPTKRGERWEIYRLKAWCSTPIAAKRLRDIAPADIAEWRDARLKEVAPGSVAREMTLLSAVFGHAVREWGLLSRNPMTGVRKPTQPPARDRVPTPAELDAMRIAAGEDLGTVIGRAFHAFLFSIETAMRAGEVCGLTWRDVDLARRVAHLPMTKNGTARDVPLSGEAVRLLEALPRADPVFGLTTAQLDANFRKLRDRAGVKGLTYHDSRHAAITALARKLDVLDLARMVGHRNISQLLGYYNPTAEDIAKRLD